MGGQVLVAAALYLAIVLSPLAVILLGPVARDRGFAIEFGVALGFIGLAMLGLQSVLTARFPRASVGLGQDSVLQFHRQAGLVAYGLVLAHPVVLIGADAEFWGFLDPRVNLPRAIALVTAIVVLPVLIGTSLWREHMRIPYEWWRLTHGGMAMLIVAIGIVHIFRVSYYLNEPWKQALWIAIAAGSIMSVAYVRLLRPMRLRRHPYRVTELAQVAEGLWRLIAEPEVPPALAFRAGQFAALTIAHSPFSLEQHPFSIASSARRTDRLEFLVKELGDYTDRIGTIPIGSRAYVDGPFGTLTLPDEPACPGVLLIAGGIGLAPILSMIRTLRDEGSRLRVVVIVANHRVVDVAFAEELAGSEGEPNLDLRVVHVLSDPPAGWDEESGRVDVDLIARYLPKRDADRWYYVLCGPPRMMETVERALLAMGVPLDRIGSERFDIGAAGAIGPRQSQIRWLVTGLGVVMVVAGILFAVA